MSDQGIDLRRRHRAAQGSGQALVSIAAAAQHHRVALAAVGQGCAHQSHIADVMLRAGVGTTGEVYVDGLIQGEALFEVANQFGAVFLGIGQRQFATHLPGASHGAGGKRAGASCHPGRFDPLAHRLQRAFGQVGNKHVLPHGEAQLVAALGQRHIAEQAHLSRRQAAHFQGDAEIMQAGLFLRVHADMPLAIDRRPGQIEGRA